AAAAGIYALVSRTGRRDLALWVVLLWAVMPAAFVQWMDYTEALYTALAAWCLYALVRGRRLTAATLCLVAGLDRSNAVTLIFVVCLSSLIAAFRLRAADRLCALAAVLVAPLGVAGYLGYIGVRTGSLHAWFEVENAPGWQSGFDFGRQTLNLFRWAESTRNRGDRNELLLDIVLLAMLVTVLLLAILLRGRSAPWEVLLWVT